MICSSNSTLLTNRFADAFAFALSLHAHQVRKVRPVPYMAHLMSVAALVLEDGGNETEAIAALLHDAVEDQGGAATRIAILHRFGPEVVALVDVCTEPPRQPDQSWRFHKVAYLHQVQQGSEGAKRVVLADKLHNLRSLLVNLDQQGNAIWAKFAGSREDYFWFYGLLAELFEADCQSSLASEFGQKVRQLQSRTNEKFLEGCRGKESERG